MTGRFLASATAAVLIPGALAGLVSRNCYFGLLAASAALLGVIVGAVVYHQWNRRWAGKTEARIVPALVSAILAPVVFAVLFLLFALAFGEGTHSSWAMFALCVLAGWPVLAAIGALFGSGIGQRGTGESR